MVSSQEYMDFLALLYWPQKFRAYLDSRKIELLSEKENLYSQMEAEKKKILDQIDFFFNEITMLKEVGLYPLDHRHCELRVEAWSKLIW